MTVELTRETTVPASPETVWEFIADPARRADAISVVEEYELAGDTATWYVTVPLPFSSKTLAVETTETDRRPPEYVRFVGSAPGVDVTGVHTLTAVAEGTTLSNQFVVSGTLPGVERYFKRNLDTELANLEQALRQWL